MEIVPGRVCGGCNVCCVQPAIIDPDLKKPAGVVCPYATPKAGCSIHARRCQTCRGHFCGWMMMAELGDEWRPDLSGIYISLTSEVPKGFGDGVSGVSGCIVITILDRLDEARRAGLATLAGMLIEKNLPVFLLAAAPPERSRNGLPLNPLLARYAGLDAAVFRQAFDIIMDSAWQMPVV